MIHGAAAAQLIGVPGTQPKRGAYVFFTAEPQSIGAGKPAFIQLQFRVAEGFHVNSHTPVGELLIPTQLGVQPAEGFKVSEPTYPAGVPYRFSSAPAEKLDVYTGPFTLKLPVIAAAGEHTLNATLKYQACDQAACYPPKTLPVSVTFSAR